MIWLLDFTHKWYFAVLVLLQLISLSIVSSRSLHVVANDRISFLPMAEQYSTVYTFRHLHLFICWWMSSWFPHRGRGEQCCIKHGSAGILYISGFIPLDISPEVGLLDHETVQHCIIGHDGGGVEHEMVEGEKFKKLIFYVDLNLQQWRHELCENVAMSQELKIKKKREWLHGVRELDTRTEEDGGVWWYESQSWEILYGRKGESSWEESWETVWKPTLGPVVEGLWEKTQHILGRLHGKLCLQEGTRKWRKHLEKRGPHRDFPHCGLLKPEAQWENFRSWKWVGGHCT